MIKRTVYPDLGGHKIIHDFLSPAAVICSRIISVEIIIQKKFGNILCRHRGFQFS